MRAALALDTSPSSPLTAAAAPLIRASQRTTSTGIGSPEIGKLATALDVSLPQSCLRAGIFRAQTLAAECRELPRECDGVVVGGEKTRPREHAQLAVGQQRQRLLG